MNDRETFVFHAFHLVSEQHLLKLCPSPSS